jgi:hypothetical protein
VARRHQLDEQAQPPPEGVLTEDEARVKMQAFLDEQTRIVPAARVIFARCSAAFLAHCEVKGLSPNTMPTYRNIVRELDARWGQWRGGRRRLRRDRGIRDSLNERGLAGSTLNQRRSVPSGIFKRARKEFRVGIDPLDALEVPPKSRLRGLFGVQAPSPPREGKEKAPHLQGFCSAGGGTRTPDTRIMIPLL